MHMPLPRCRPNRSIQLAPEHAPEHASVAAVAVVAAVAAVAVDFVFVFVVFCLAFLSWTDR
jgi:hypothetical protein